MNSPANLKKQQQAAANKLVNLIQQAGPDKAKQLLEKMGRMLGEQKKGK
jgi:hypothetical protein